MPSMMINNEEYILSDKLMVAFKLQAANNHKPYMQIFDEISNFPVEKQIEFLWLALDLANDELPGLKNPSIRMTKGEFQEYFLDNYGLDYLLDKLVEIMDGIMYRGLSEEEVAAKKAKRQQERENRQQTED